MKINGASTDVLTANISWWVVLPLVHCMAQMCLCCWCGCYGQPQLLAAASVKDAVSKN